MACSVTAFFESTEGPTIPETRDPSTDGTGLAYDVHVPGLPPGRRRASTSPPSQRHN